MRDESILKGWLIVMGAIVLTALIITAGTTYFQVIKAQADSKVKIAEYKYERR